eukprot:gene23100-30298_t
MLLFRLRLIKVPDWVRRAFRSGIALCILGTIAHGGLNQLIPAAIPPEYASEFMRLAGWAEATAILVNDSLIGMIAQTAAEQTLGTISGGMLGYVVLCVGAPFMSQAVFNVYQPKTLSFSSDPLNAAILKVGTILVGVLLMQILSVVVLPRSATVDSMRCVRRAMKELLKLNACVWVVPEHIAQQGLWAGRDKKENERECETHLAAVFTCISNTSASWVPQGGECETHLAAVFTFISKCEVIEKLATHREHQHKYQKHQHKDQQQYQHQLGGTRRRVRRAPRRRHHCIAITKHKGTMKHQHNDPAAVQHHLGGQESSHAIIHTSTSTRSPAKGTSSSTSTSWVGQGGECKTHLAAVFTCISQHQHKYAEAPAQGPAAVPTSWVGQGVSARTHLAAVATCISQHQHKYQKHQHKDQQQYQHQLGGTRSTSTSTRSTSTRTQQQYQHQLGGQGGECKTHLAAVFTCISQHQHKYQKHQHKDQQQYQHQLVFTCISQHQHKYQKHQHKDQQQYQHQLGGTRRRVQDTPRAESSHALARLATCIQPAQATKYQKHQHKDQQQYQQQLGGTRSTSTSTRSTSTRASSSTSNQMWGQEERETRTRPGFTCISQHQHKYQKHQHKDQQQYQHQLGGTRSQAQDKSRAPAQRTSPAPDQQQLIYVHHGWGHYLFMPGFPGLPWLGAWLGVWRLPVTQIESAMAIIRRLAQHMWTLHMDLREGFNEEIMELFEKMEGQVSCVLADLVHAFPSKRAIAVDHLLQFRAILHTMEGLSHDAKYTRLVQSIVKPEGTLQRTNSVRQSMADGLASSSGGDSSSLQRRLSGNAVVLSRVATNTSTALPQVPEKGSFIFPKSDPMMVPLSPPPPVPEECSYIFPDSDPMLVPEECSYIFPETDPLMVPLSLFDFSAAPSSMARTISAEVGAASNKKLKSISLVACAYPEREEEEEGKPLGHRLTGGSNKGEQTAQDDEEGAPPESLDMRRHSPFFMACLATASADSRKMWSPPKSPPSMSPIPGEMGPPPDFLDPRPSPPQTTQDLRHPDGMPPLPPGARSPPLPGQPPRPPGARSPPLTGQPTLPPGARSPPNLHASPPCQVMPPPSDWPPASPFSFDSNNDISNTRSDTQTSFTLRPSVLARAGTANVDMWQDLGVYDLNSINTPNPNTASP